MKQIIKGKKKTLRSEFAFLMGLLMAIIVLFMALYIHFFITCLSKDIQKRSDTFNQVVATFIFANLGNDLKYENYSGIEKKTSNLITNQLLSYVVIRDLKTKKIVYSSEKDLIGKQIVPTNKIMSNYIQDGKNKDTNTYNIMVEMYGYSIHLGFFQDPILIKYLDSFTRHLTALVAAFVGLSLILATFMSKMVTKPIRMLVDSSSQFAKGDLSHRIKKTQFDEINQLIDAYNLMAANLEQLYISMDKEVKARTVELNNTVEELKQTQSMMVHSEKMKSLGELVAGITHEINNPINFIYGNLIYLEDYVKQLFQLIDKYKEFKTDLTQEHSEAIDTIANEIDVDFIKSDLPDLLKSCKEGVNRTKNIIADLKNFSRLEEVVLSSIDLKKEMDTTLNILHHKFKNRIEVHKDYDEKLPQIEAYGGQLNQVFMNILDNAAGAISDNGNVWITIKKIDNNRVQILIKDDGCGMNQTTKEKIFNPFFTTKPVGQGTGLGMSISYKVIKNHDGNIEVFSEPGEGSTFKIELPIVQAKKKVR